MCLPRGDQHPSYKYRAKPQQRRARGIVRAKSRVVVLRIEDEAPSADKLCFQDMSGSAMVSAPELPRCHESVNFPPVVESRGATVRIGPGGLEDRHVSTKLSRGMSGTIASHETQLDFEAVKEGRRGLFYSCLLDTIDPRARADKFGEFPIS